MYFTLVGNRDAPVEAVQRGTHIALKLIEMGFKGRSGGADGMDSCLTRAVSILRQPDNEIYIPKQPFKGLRHGDLGRTVIDASQLANYDEARAIAEQLVPHWHNCDDFSRAAHTRNVYEVLGVDLATPSKFLVCYAKTNSLGVVVGGTASAVQLALQLQIPVFNFYVEECGEALMTLANACLEPKDPLSFGNMLWLPAIVHDALIKSTIEDLQASAERVWTELTAPTENE